MLTYKNMYCHNIYETVPSPIGERLYRFPKSVYDNLSDIGRLAAVSTAGCELRFVFDGLQIQLLLGSLNPGGYVHIFRGDFHHSTVPLKEGKVNKIMLMNDEGFNSMPPAYLKGRFAPQVWRIMPARNTVMTVVDVIDSGYPMRPPTPEEMPNKTLLIYGTSVSHGDGSTAYPLVYSMYTGQLLEMDTRNYGMGGSCYSERELVDFIAKVDCDAILIENVLNLQGAIDRYEKAAPYLFDTLAKKGKPMFALTATRNSHILVDGAPTAQKQALETDQLVRDLAAKYDNMHVIEGDTAMPDMRYLSADLVHLSDHGNVQMAMNIAKIMRPYL